jgi:aerobic-type carbon monoxide dehydrogenase small subunit (CoxS/CutS family)
MMPRETAGAAAGELSITFELNGATRSARARTEHTILDVLRWQMNLTGPREGCGVGMCGACTILLDGRPVSGCLLLAVMADGRKIATVEGLEGPAGLHPIQQAFIDHSGFQCAYCTPGFVMATKALLDENPSPTVADVKTFLAGNLCRCGSYVKIVDAVMDAATRLASHATTSLVGADAR